MYGIWIKYINIFEIRNLSFKTIVARSAFFVLLLVFLYFWRQPLGDILLLISYICIYERSRFDAKSYLDYVHLASFSLSGVHKFTLMYLSHLLNCKFLFFIAITIMSIINDYSNIFYTSVILLVLLILNLFTLNIDLQAMRSIKIFHIVKVIFSILMSAPFLLVYVPEMYYIRDMIDDFYTTNTFDIVCLLIVTLPLFFVLNYRWFQHILCRRPFPSLEVVEKIHDGKYFSLF
jgi:hypothetical protein